MVLDNDLWGARKGPAGYHRCYRRTGKGWEVAQLPESGKQGPVLGPPWAVFVSQNLTGVEWVTSAMKSTNIRKRLQLVPGTQANFRTFCLGLCRVDDSLQSPC